MSVILETSIGDITIDLYTKERPRCCLNFLKLCKIKYYNFCLFHRIQRNLVAQSGDPLGTGQGGESIYRLLHKNAQSAYFAGEIKPQIKHKKFGTISMISNGDNLHGSQFFLTLDKDIDYLNEQQHTVFGHVAEGFEVLQKINEAIVDAEFRPYQDIRILHTVILEDPFDDPPGLEVHIPNRSPNASNEQNTTNFRIGFDEEMENENTLNASEVENEIKEKEAHTNAQILEMIGDLPTLDVKPPDNILFVCKLNPVTTSEDLEVIFSRFGPINSCEVIKDQRTGESLQYAFIEFREIKDCEGAYFKMDNVLIDDRRIHVDFSQSVSKMKWRRKGMESEYKNSEEINERTQFKIINPDKQINAYDYVFDHDEQEKDSTRNLRAKLKKERKYKKHSWKSDTDSMLLKRIEKLEHRSRSRSTKHSKESDTYSKKSS